MKFMILMKFHTLEIQILMHGEWVHDPRTDLNIIDNVDLQKVERQAGLGRGCLMLVKGTGCVEIQCDQTIRGKGRIAFW